MIKYAREDRLIGSVLRSVLLIMLMGVVSVPSLHAQVREPSRDARPRAIADEPAVRFEKVKSRTGLTPLLRSFQSKFWRKSHDARGMNRSKASDRPSSVIQARFTGAIESSGADSVPGTILKVGAFEPQSQLPRPEGEPVTIPLHGTQLTDRVKITNRNGKMSLVVRSAPIGEVLGLIAQEYQLDLVTADTVQGNISVTLSDVPLDDALDAILKVNGYTWTRERNILLITPVGGESKISPTSQGRRLSVFSLNYVSAVDVDKVVKGLLSPAGQSFPTEAASGDKKKTLDQIVVEDLPEYVTRIESYIRQVDRPPRQVLIEAHILQVNLQDDTRTGVNLDELVARLGGAEISVSTKGFVNPASSSAFFVNLTSTDLSSVVDLLKVTNNAKTLASPKVLALNGQEARIQIGAQLGYLVTTTTQTSTLQQVEFLDVGVVLRVTPQIADDNRVLMTVAPEVSSGQINDTTGLPEEETTEVQTSLMLPDGHGMIIGGLIQETDIENQTKIPVLGDLWLIGRIFQRRTVNRQRNEIIIALIPRVVPYTYEIATREGIQLERTQTRLLDGQLNRLDRRAYEPDLPDAMRDPRRLKLGRLFDFFKDFSQPTPHPIEYYFPSRSEDSPSFPGYIYESTVPYDSFPGRDVGTDAIYRAPVANQVRED